MSIVTILIFLDILYTFFIIFRLYIYFWILFSHYFHLGFNMEIFLYNKKFFQNMILMMTQYFSTWTQHHTTSYHILLHNPTSQRGLPRSGSPTLIVSFFRLV